MNDTGRNHLFPKKPCSCQDSNDINNNPINKNIFKPTITVNPTIPNPSPSSDIQFAFTECLNNANDDNVIVINPVSGTTYGPVTILSLPPIFVAGEIVKLESMAVVRLRANTTTYRYIIQYRLLRNGVEIASSEKVETTAGSEITETCNLTWVDNPLPGVYTYSIEVTVFTTSSPSPNLIQRDVANRVLTATLYPPSNVLPSTFCTP